MVRAAHSPLKPMPERIVCPTRAVLAATLLSCPFPLVAQAPDQSLPDIPVHVTQAAAALVQRAAEIDLVWPGFWRQPRPYVLIDFHQEKGALLFTPYDPIEGYALIADAALPAALHGLMYARPGAFNADFLGDAVTAWDEATPATVPLTGPEGMANGSSQTEAIIHEAFHFWQLSRWNDHHRRQPADCTPQRYDAISVKPPAGFADAAVREMQILASAVAATEQDERIDRTRNYLAARQARLSAADALFRAVDQRQERREGSAQFAGLAGSLAVAHDDPARARTALRDTLVAQLTGFKAFVDELEADADQEAAFRVYFTGAAMAFLLDDLNAENWRAAVEQGAFLDMLLAQSVDAHEYVRTSSERATNQACTIGLAVRSLLPARPHPRPGGITAFDGERMPARVLLHPTRSGALPWAVCTQAPQLVFGARVAQYADTDGLTFSVSEGD